MMRRRDFVAGLAAAAVGPVVARAQQPTFPIIGYLSPSSPEVAAPFEHSAKA
jgi:hypothetical protein